MKTSKKKLSDLLTSDFSKNPGTFYLLNLERGVHPQTQEVLVLSRGKQKQSKISVTNFTTHSLFA